MGILIEEHARELVAHGPNWRFYEWEAIRDHIRGQLVAMKVTGAVAPLKSRGVNKGQPNWRKLDRSTREVVYITPEAHREWCVGWEKRTGKCSECAGAGRVFTGWSAAGGTRTKVCPRCRGNGSAEKPTPVRQASA